MDAFLEKFPNAHRLLSSQSDATTAKVLTIVTKSGAEHAVSVLREVLQLDELLVERVYAKLAHPSDRVAEVACCACRPLTEGETNWHSFFSCRCYSP